MLLKEFIYFDKKHSEMVDDNRYNSDKDSSILNFDDTRKTRLTFRLLNDLRKASESKEKEKKEELALVRKMYAAPPPEAAPA